MTWSDRLHRNDGFLTIRESEHVAHKDHSWGCFICNKPIRAGQRYVYHVGIIDYSFGFAKHHRECGS